MTTADDVLNIARGQLGVMEGPGEANPYSEWLDHADEYWCCAFVSWVFDRAGIGSTCHTSSCTNAMTGYQAGGAFDRHPQVGDQVMFSWGQGHGPEYIDHTGIVESIDPDGTLHTIEGNAYATGRPPPGSDHDGVARHVRPFDGTVVGFGHPPYAAAAAPAPPPPPPTTTQTGDPDVATIVNLPVGLDAQGNGYNDLDGVGGRPFVAMGKVIGLYLNASDPATTHRYSPIPALAADDFAGHARVVVEGGPPSGTVLVHVSVAA